MNPLKKFKNHVHTNPRTYITTAAAVGLVTGVTIGIKIAWVTPQQSLDAWRVVFEAHGLNMDVLNAFQKEICQPVPK